MRLPTCWACFKSEARFEIPLNTRRSPFHVARPKFASGVRTRADGKPFFRRISPDAECRLPLSFHLFWFLQPRCRGVKQFHRLADKRPIANVLHFLPMRYRPCSLRLCRIFVAKL